jgi:hypothetical protein
MGVLIEKPKVSSRFADEIFRESQYCKIFASNIKELGTFYFLFVARSNRLREKQFKRKFWDTL